MYRANITCGCPHPSGCRAPCPSRCSCRGGASSRAAGRSAGSGRPGAGWETCFPLAYFPLEGEPLADSLPSIWMPSRGPAGGEKTTRQTLALGRTTERVLTGNRHDVGAEAGGNGSDEGGGEIHVGGMYMCVYVCIYGECRSGCMYTYAEKRCVLGVVGRVRMQRRRRLHIQSVQTLHTQDEPITSNAIQCNLGQGQVARARRHVGR